MIGDRLRRAAHMLHRDAQEATPGPWHQHDFGDYGQDEPSSIVVHTGKFDHADLSDHESETAIAWMQRWDAQEAANATYLTRVFPAVGLALADVLERIADRADEIEDSMGSSRVAASVVANNVPGWDEASYAADLILGRES